MSQAQPGIVSRQRIFSDESYERELDEVFAGSWLFVGHESEIPAPGDYVTRKMAADPVVVVRALSGEIRVLLNSCAHRGTQLCRADVGNTSHFRCMYHGWTYDTDGRLRGVPGLRQWYSPDFQRSGHGLRRARVGVFQGLVFATWNEDAPSLDDYLGDFGWYLQALFGRASAGWEVIGEPLRWISRTNWKISVENFGMDSLHLGSLHENSIRLGIFGATDQQPTAITSVCAGGHGIEATKLIDPAGARSYPGYPEELWPEFEENLSASAAWYASNNLVCKGNVFPNLGFIDLFHDYTGDPSTPPAVAATMLRLVHPTGPYRSEVSMWILVPRDADEQWKRWSQDSLVRTLGVSGTFEPDDLENTAAISAANAGRLARRWDMLFVAGEHYAAQDEIDGHDLPGHVIVSAMNTESMQRNFYQELDRRLSREESS
jgi:PAH dioxygenase large subunit